MAISIKDYYQILEVPTDADAETIKKSFRKLAHEFHPDKNQHNTFADAHFIEVKEAYHILSNEDKRALYDHERWLSGKFKNRRALAITPQYLMLEVKKLNSHLATMDVYRMNKQLLHEYLLLLLQDSYIGVLQLKADETTTKEFVRGILKATNYLPFYFAEKIFSRLFLLINDDKSSTLHHEVEIKYRSQKRAHLIEKRLPWLIVAITISLMFVMYYFAKR